MSEFVGHVVSTELKPNTAYAFGFWARKEARLGIGSVVKVEFDDSTVYGMVVEAHAYNDVPNAMADFLGAQGRPDAFAPTARPEIRFFQAAVLRRMPEEPVTAVGIGAVSKASAEDIRTALRGDKFENGIPVGVYGSKDEFMPVLVDPLFLLGPEAGHLNVTGTSGLAAKTSYIQFLLQCIFQKYTEPECVAALLFNVKGGDLLYMEQPSREQLPPEHARIYEICGVRPEPFGSVEYWAPFTDEGQSDLRTLRNHPKLMMQNPTRGFCYGLKQVLQHAEVLLSREDLDAKADAFLQYLYRDAAEQDNFRTSESHIPTPVKTLRELVDVVQEMLKEAETSGNSSYRSHHAATIRKMANRLNGFSLRFPGLISDSGDAQPPLPDKFEDRTLYVIDVAQMDPDGQDLVFAAVVGELRERMEQRRLGVGKLIVVVDELNKFAPSGGRETYVLQSLRDIAARGRYLGLVLFGAQQFRSRVDAQIIGNCANSASGQIQMEELTNPIYTVYSQAVREKLATAGPGEMMLRHPHFTQPVFVRFPLPSVLRGDDGMKTYPHQASKSLEERILELARQLDPKLNPGKVGDLLARLSARDRSESLLRISRELAAAVRDGGGEPERIIRTAGKFEVATVEIPKKTVKDDDPFA